MRLSRPLSGLTVERHCLHPFWRDSISPSRPLCVVCVCCPHSAWNWPVFLHPSSGDLSFICSTTEGRSLLSLCQCIIVFSSQQVSFRVYSSSSAIVTVARLVIEIQTRYFSYFGSDCEPFHPLYLSTSLRMEEIAFRYGGWPRIYWISSRGQPTRGGPPAGATVGRGASNSTP
jgi:hypothetical protein